MVRGDVGEVALGKGTPEGRAVWFSFDRRGHFGRRTDPGKVVQIKCEVMGTRFAGDKGIGRHDLSAPAGTYVDDMQVTFGYAGQLGGVQDSQYLRRFRPGRYEICYCIPPAHGRVG